jgi:hypothetical protein
MENNINYMSLQKALAEKIDHPILFGKLDFSSYNGDIVLDCDVQDDQFCIELIFVPTAIRNQGYASKIIKVLEGELPKHNITSIVVYPFPCDTLDTKEQRYVKINKLVKFYSKFGFNLLYSEAFYGYFKMPSGRINYKEKVYYDDLCGCNGMELKLEK